VRDILKEGETGFVVPRKDVHAFAEKLAVLVTNEEIRKKMSQNGWKFVQEQFHYTTLVSNMEQYYRELLMKKTPKQISRC